MNVYGHNQAILDIPVATKTKHKRLVVESIAPKARVRPAPFKPRIPHFRMQVKGIFGALDFA